MGTKAPNIPRSAPTEVFDKSVDLYIGKGNHRFTSCRQNRDLPEASSLFQLAAMAPTDGRDLKISTLALFAGAMGARISA